MYIMMHDYGMDVVFAKLVGVCQGMNQTQF